MMRLDDLAGVAAIEGETLSSWSIVSLEQEMGVSQGIQLVAEESDCASGLGQLYSSPTNSGLVCEWARGLGEWALYN